MTGSTRLADLHTADRQQSGSRRLQQTLNYQEPTTPTFTVFSALHDKSLGQVNSQRPLLAAYHACMQLDIQ